MLQFGCSGHFPPLQWTRLRRTFAVVGIFPFIPMGMLQFWLFWAFSLHCNGHVGHALFWASFLCIQTGMLRFGCSGHLSLCIQKGMLRFGCSGHLFLSWSWTCCVWAFRGIFLSCKWACRILVVLAILSLHWDETFGGGSVSNSSGAPWVLINCAVGVKIARFNRRENRRLLAGFDRMEITHLGALRNCVFLWVAVKIDAATRRIVRFGCVQVLTAQGASASNLQWHVACSGWPVSSEMRCHFLRENKECKPHDATQLLQPHRTATEQKTQKLKKSGGATPEVEKPPRASRRKIAP